MLRDIEESNYHSSFEIQTYHDLVSWCMKTGFKWIRYEWSYNKNHITVYNLKMPNCGMGIDHANIIKRFIRWYNWMKGNEKNERQRSSRTK